MGMQQHRLLSKDIDNLTGECLVCGPNTPLWHHKAQNRYLCANRRKESKREWAAKNYSTAKNRWESQENRFGLTEEKWNALFDSQGRVCAVCKTDKPGGRGWHTDHDRNCCPTHRMTCHECVRGILCSNCNTALGLLKDNPETLRNALTYLEG